MRIVLGSLQSVKTRGELVVKITIAAFLLTGIFYSVHLGDAVKYPDELQYRQLAQNIISCRAYTLDGIHPTAYRPPVYPLIIALVFSAGGGVITVRLLQFLSIGFAAWVTYRGLTQEGRPVAGLVAPMLILCYPVLFYTTGTLYPQSLGSLILVLIVFALYRGANARLAYLAAGVGYGLLVLMIPGFFLLTPIFVFSPWLLSKSRPALLASFFVGSVIVVLFPWTVRNILVLHEFVPVSTSSGINLLLGNSNNAGPNTGVNVDLSEYNPSGLDEVGLDRYYRQMALQWVQSHPMQAAELYFLKVLNYFNYRNELATSSESGGWKDVLMILTYGPLLLIAVVRALIYKRFPYDRFEIFLYFVYVAHAFIAAITFTRIRLRMPFDLMLILAVAFFFNDAISRHQQSRTGDSIHPNA